MNGTNYITASCRITCGEVILNGQLDHSDKTQDNAVDFLKSVYKKYELNYPKFYKMDSLCKLAFVCSDLLMRSNKITEKYNADEIAIITANGSSSLDIDTEHQQTIADEGNYFPSPAVFVYTLPNILIGEIAIRNVIKGENSFFIFDKFDARFMANYVNSVLNTGKAKSCIAGWVDFYENKYDAFLYIVEKTSTHTNTEHNEKQLTNLYKQN